MKHSNNYQLGCYEKAMPNSISIEEKLKEIKRCGFDSMEISIDETDEKLARLDMNLNERLQVIRAMFSTGIFIRSMCLSGHRKYPLGSEDPEIRKKSLEIMKKAIDFSDDIGIRMVQIAGYDEYYHESNDETKRWFLENLQVSVDMAAGKGVILAFETMETSFMNTVEKALYYVKVIDSPYLQIYPDSGNISNAAAACSEDVLKDLSKGRGHIAAIHLKETKPGIFREMHFGSGEVDFSGIVRKGFKLGVRRFLAEFWCSDTMDWRTQMKESNAFLREIIDPVSRQYKVI